jgi:L-lactate dehydrogenase complex protein LldF
MNATVHKEHAELAGEFVQNRQRAKWHDSSLWFVRQKRDRQTQTIPEWEQLRSLASTIKQHTLAKLPYYLEEFERNATKLGAVVHWARDAEEHNRIVCQILKDYGAKKIVKSKSMLTEECHLNPFLEQNGIEVVDTDLGEWIVQLRHEPPSHIVMPAIHIKKQEISELFHEKLGTEEGNSDPTYLAREARYHLRQKFVQADAGITGVNFAVASTGGVVVCTNEGNADLGVSLPKLHIACMGIEKLIPRSEDLSVFTRLLGRSATGQPITAYTSHFHGPRPGCQLHIVIVDNGRSAIRASQDFQNSLNCIRCGACMNTCPVYRRSGGHSYSNVVPGPIGSILAPSQDPKNHGDLPFACTLCGSCSDVCPVKIDIHHQLLTWRRELAIKKIVPWTKRWSMSMASIVLKHPWVYSVGGKVARLALRVMPRWMIYNGLNAWGKQRDLPPAPKKSFRELYRQRGNGNGSKDLKG